MDNIWKNLIINGKESMAKYTIWKGEILSIKKYLLQSIIKKTQNKKKKENIEDKY